LQNQSDYFHLVQHQCYWTPKILNLWQSEEGHENFEGAIQSYLSLVHVYDLLHHDW